MPVNKIDVGPYWIWQEADGCIVREVKPFKDLHEDFQYEGFEPALETIPYSLDQGVLTVTANIGLWGWQIAEPRRIPRIPHLLSI